MFLQSCKSFFCRSLLFFLPEEKGSIKYSRMSVFCFLLFFLLLKTRALHLVDDSLGEDITSLNVLDTNQLINDICIAKILVMIKKAKYMIIITFGFNGAKLIQKISSNIQKMIFIFLFLFQKKQLVLTYDVINTSTLNI